MRKIKALGVLFFLGCTSVLSGCATGPVLQVSAPAPNGIRVNQLGYNPWAQKLAVVPAGAATKFRVVKTDSQEVVFGGDLSPTKTWAEAQDAVRLADFSPLRAPGNYRLVVDGQPAGPDFTVRVGAYDDLNTAAIRAFYFNRASTALPESTAGVYQRPAGHADTQVKIHSSAASSGRPAGSLIAAPKGWYDAGDYNKYIVNSGISTYTLLAAYESFPAYFKQQHLNIPESGNGVPDLLNEVKWNLDWMLAMQDPNDGGVYHKLTSQRFSAFAMPATDTAERYVVMKTTAAALDFAAVMATASRVYGAYETVYPGLSARMLTAAKNAWAWAQANPRVFYKQPTDIHTGEYSDSEVADEFAWAAAELYITTRDDRYYLAMDAPRVTIDVPSWAVVKSLAWVSLARHINALTPAADKKLIHSRLNELAAGLVAKKAASAYGVSLVASDFEWGSNGNAMNQAFMLLAAYQLDHDAEYVRAAQSLLDYVLGRNPLDYSFVSGFGRKFPQHLHHRPSGADGIAGSLPGFLAGGANAGQQDKCSGYSSRLPARSYVDDECSFASNEVAINWNAPLVYVTAGLQVLAP